MLELDVSVFARDLAEKINAMYSELVDQQKLLCFSELYWFSLLACCWIVDIWQER